ncbi:MAG: hypothetical protein QNL33_15665 [Akkermansiaceae bacterium]
METRLNSRRQDLLDLHVRVGRAQKSCRLIAVRADEKIVHQRGAQRRQRAKEVEASPCPKGLIRDGWHLMHTNLTLAQSATKQLVKPYCARWAIEIQFPARKQSGNLDKALTSLT